MTLRAIARTVRRAARLSPMQRVMRELIRRGVRLGELDALEMFGGPGIYHTLDYVRRVRTIEAWEIDPERGAEFAGNIPRAKIRIGDTYSLAKDASMRYGLVVADNPMSTHGGHVEHFDLFPLILGLLADDAVVIVNIIPAITPRGIRRFPFIDDAEQRRARSIFYGCDTPDDIPITTIRDTLARHAADAGFHVEWVFTRRRHVVYYLAMRVRRRS